MGGIVNLRQMLKIQMCINLRGSDTRMTEHFLYGAQIARGLQHVAGEGVAQHVRMHVQPKTALFRPVRQAQFYGARRQARAASTDKERRLVRCGKTGTLPYPGNERRRRL